VAALYVFDPGPEGSIGDTKWIADARASGAIGLLIVQGVLLTSSPALPIFVLPGASSWRRKRPIQISRGGIPGPVARVPLPGEAKEDWEILVSLAAALGVPFSYQSAADVRRDIAAAFPVVAELQGWRR